MNIKNAKTFNEQIEILKDRNLEINDIEQAKTFLSNVNYYRFTAYLINYKTNNGNYEIGTKFDTIKKIYLFDQELRHLISSILEVIELSFRTYIAYTIAHLCGPLGYKEYRNFIDSTMLCNKDVNDDEYIKDIFRKHSIILDEIEKALHDNKSKIFIKHHKLKYNSDIPVWVLVEVLTFGTISRLYKLMTSEQKKHIKILCPVNQSLVTSWLGSLNKLRNECAHHGRLYGVNLSKIKVANKYNKDVIDDISLFSYILAIKELVYSFSIWSAFKTDLTILISKYSQDIDIKNLGFPNNWFEILSK
ncbi:Abi family protein [Peptostreptococcus anaerobius]|uniref:Abi family protein n=1 Tax=Peptostreptococcus porci TaxID=2652282 RepID=A0A6N7XF44_9FIRM|nr:Abi family protein [Peptostreptococcus porci]MST62223.1 Abi family protein [Peptostreptococcus porci]